MKVILTNPNDNTLDVVQLANDVYMYRGVYDETVDLFLRDPAIEELIKLRTRYHVAKTMWCECTDKNLIESRTIALSVARERYNGAKSIATLVYGEETINNVLFIDDDLSEK